MENKNDGLKKEFIQTKMPYITSVDIGGSLVKVVILVSDLNNLPKDFSLDEYRKVELKSKNLILLLSKFHTRDFLSKIKLILDKLPLKTLQATGGGAYRFREQMDKLYNVAFDKHDELLSLVSGYTYMNTLDSFFYKVGKNNEMIDVPPSDLKFPHLTVNVGSGVSILIVTSTKKEDIIRVGGTIMGGESLIGIGRLLLGIDKYEELLKLAEKGKNINNDITMGEFFQKNGMNMDSSFSCSSFDKIVDYNITGKENEIKKEDIAKSLILMICAHLAQIATLFAEESADIKQILFFGNFTVKNSYAVNLLNECMRIYGNKYEVRFNKLEGYFGAIGSLLGET